MSDHDARPLDIKLLAALVGVIMFHGGLSLYGTYRNTYDAFVHIFFADHWTRSWFDHWDPRWYTGFTLTSYPPLSQQSVAALSYLTDDLGLAFVIVQTAAMATLAVGMYRFAQIWVSKDAAGWAAIWLVFSTAMAETVHVFGQLPTTYSLGLLLNGLPFAYRWVRAGRSADLLRAFAFTAATTGAHHVTTLFGAVFITAPVIVLAIVEHFRIPLADEPDHQLLRVTRANVRALIARRTRRILPQLLRSGVFAVGTIFLLLLVVFPYWVWSSSDPITQVPIPHASRDNFLINRNAGLVFWVIPYGMLFFVIPYVYTRGLFSRAWPLVASIALLMLLGTGGTTPIPKLLLGGAFDILTLDRFTLWASILMLPLAGAFVVSLLKGGIATWIQTQFGMLTWRTACLLLGSGLLISAVLTVSLTQFRRFQPAPIETQPIVNFMQKDQHERWRYLTLGFGDQMAWLSAQMEATQVDGNYHSARRLPELTTTPVERLEGAKFRGIPGIGSLQQFLTAPDKYNLKYLFSNDQFYDPLLFFNGWHRVQYLENGIAVWEREDIPVLPAVLPRREIPLYQRLMFGILPPLALFAAILASTVHVWTLPLRLLAELLGLAELQQRLARFNPLLRLWQRVNRRLLSASYVQQAAQGEIPPWQLWLRDRWQRRQIHLNPASLRARQVRSVALLVLVSVGLVTLFLRMNVQQSDPEEVIYAYYEDLDFRRFGDAYARLDPDTRPDFEQYQLILSVQGGLVASYSKLDAIRTEFLQRDADYARARVDARYITALSYYTDTVTLELSRHPQQGWTIAPPSADVTTPPEQLVRRPAIQWLAQGRTRVTSATTNFADILDRPELEVLSSRLLIGPEGGYSLVGEVINLDVDPADLTVTGYLYDEEGELLTWYNAGVATMHKLRPKEITPFRVDFEGVAGLALETPPERLDFEPGATFAFELPERIEIGAYNVFAKAVVTTRDLARDVGVQRVEVRQEEGIFHLSGELINSGLQEAVIPQLIVTLYDKDLRVAWVDNHFLRSSVRPQRAVPFSVAIPSPETMATVTAGGENYANTLSVDRFQPARPELLQMPADSGYAFAAINVYSFTGGSR